MNFNQIIVLNNISLRRCAHPMTIKNHGRGRAWSSVDVGAQFETLVVTSQASPLLCK